MFNVNHHMLNVITRQLSNKHGVIVRYHTEENPLRHCDSAAYLHTSPVQEQIEIVYFQPFRTSTLHPGMSHRRKR